MHITFTPIERSEIDIVLQLFKEAAVRIAQMNIDHWQYWHNPPAEKVAWVEAGIKNKEFYFIKNSAEITIGMLRMMDEDLLYWGPQKDKSIYIHSLIVKEAYAGNGIGEIILKQIAHDAQSKGCQYLRLDADAKNEKLCAYYTKQGFEQVGVQELTISSYNLYQLVLNQNP